MAKKSRSFDYRGDRRDDAETERHNQASGSFDSLFKDGVVVFRPKEGENVLRILPDSWPDEDVERWGAEWNLKIEVHYQVGADEGSYLCLKLIGKDCPICDARASMDKDEAEAVKLSPRRAVWLIDRNDEKAGPKVWAMPEWKVFKEIATRAYDKKTKAIIKIDHPEEGFDIVFSADKKGDFMQYSGVDIDREPSPIHENQGKQDRWLDYITEHPLPDVLNFFDADYLERVLTGKSARRSSETNGEDRRERRGRSRDEDEGETRTSRRRPMVEDEEEEDKRPTTRARPTSARRGSEEDEEEDRSKKSARSRDEDEDDDGEGEEDLRSASRRRTSRDDPEESRSARGAMRSLRDRASK